jgi:outer membrane lipoprotein carrier protein
MFRWEYQEPNHQEIVSDGKTMWVYLPENSQVIISDIDFSSPSSPSDPMAFLTGLGNLSRDFLITWASPDRDAGGNYVLELQPRRPSPMIQRMLVVVNRDAVLQTGAVSPPVFPMLSTTVVDPNGNSTAIEFRDVRVNRGLADSFFRFSPPEGVEVLRPTDGGTGF